MKLQDDRTDDEKRTHRYLVIATDTYLSGWGEAEGGKSFAVWACQEPHLERVQKWVKSRPEMRRIRWTYGDYRPKGKGHCHIYVVHSHHPSLTGR